MRHQCARLTREEKDDGTLTSRWKEEDAITHQDRIDNFRNPLKPQSCALVLSKGECQTFDEREDDCIYDVYDIIHCMYIMYFD